MVVITVTITDSSEELVAGFPQTISLSTNVPATIFYTTDGSTPTNLSSVYTDDPINVPTDVQEFVLKAYATNGTDTSAIITQTYVTDIFNNTRLPHATISGNSNNAPMDLYPFGSNSPSPVVYYENPANAGTTVDDPTLPEITYGYDADGNPVGANQDINDYLTVYSTTNRKNQTIPNVGNLPGKVDVSGRRTPAIYSVAESSRASALFDARAMVIFQDATTDDPSNPPQINPQLFSFERMENTKDGAPLFASSLDTPSVSGSYLRSHYNPRTQMVTNYYRDSGTNRWIIASYPYEPKGDPGNLGGMVFSRNDQGAGRVYSWNQFRYRVLT